MRYPARLFWRSMQAVEARFPARISPPGPPWVRIPPAPLGSPGLAAGPYKPSVRVQFPTTPFPFVRMMLFAFLSKTRRMYSDVVSSHSSAAVTICCHESSSIRKYRLGVCPVAGRPRPRFCSSTFAMSVFYVHPSILSNAMFYGWTNNIGPIE